MFTRSELISLWVALTLGATPWIVVCLPSKIGEAGSSPTRTPAVEPFAHVPRNESRILSPTSAWDSPSPQRHTQEWLYDVFTPPEIVYDPRSGGFIVHPPNTMVADRAGHSAEPDSAEWPLRLVNVSQPLFRLQLVGFAGTQDEPLGIFQNCSTGESFVAKAASSLADLDLVIEQLTLRRRAVELPESTVTHQLSAEARVRDVVTGEAILLTSTHATRAGAPVASITLPGSDGEIRELQIGDEFHVLDSDYTIVDVRINPPSVVIGRPVSPDAAPICRVLLPHLESSAPEVLVAQSTP
jgi:hypothetical protein